MTHLGILLACDHYPAVPADRAQLHPRLSAALAAQGITADRVTAHACHDGDMPSASGDFDAVIVSGALLIWNNTGGLMASTLVTFLRAECVAGTPLYGLYHGEHVLNDALGGVRKSETPKWPRCVRNPITNFRRNDKLFVWDPAERQVRDCTHLPASAPMIASHVTGLSPQNTFETAINRACCQSSPAF